MATNLDYYYIHPLRAAELVGPQRLTLATLANTARDFLADARRHTQLEYAVTDYISRNHIKNLNDPDDTPSLGRGDLFIIESSFYGGGLSALRRRGGVTEADIATLRTRVTLDERDVPLTVQYRPAYFASSTPWSALGGPGKTTRLLVFGRVMKLTSDEINAKAIGIADAYPGAMEELLLGGDSDFRAVVFTDVVDHTALFNRLGDSSARVILREHERITRQVLKRFGGVAVKEMGDGFMASFSSLSSAVEASIALQVAMRSRNESAQEPLDVRIGINAGEPIEENGDLFGSTVVLASRIAARAGAREILIPQAVRHLLSGKSYVYADRGETMLKGFEESVRLYEVRWQE